MSLDLEIAGEQYNYTYNAAGMWYEIFPEDEGMVYIDDMTGLEAIGKIEEAIIAMLEHKDSLRELEPENGWGSYEGFLAFLIAVREGCIRNPNEKWRACR